MLSRGAESKHTLTSHPLPTHLRELNQHHKQKETGSEGSDDHNMDKTDTPGPGVYLVSSLHLTWDKTRREHSGGWDARAASLGSVPTPPPTAEDRAEVTWPLCCSLLICKRGREQSQPQSCRQEISGYIMAWQQSLAQKVAEDKAGIR